MPDEADREVRDIDPEPAALQPFRRRDRGSAPTKRVQDQVPFVAAGLEDALQERFRFLRVG